MQLLKELYLTIKESRYHYSDEELSQGLKKYGLKRYKNNVGKGIGGFVYFHKNYIKEFPQWSENIFHKMHYLPNDFQWNVIKYNEKTGSVTFINSPDFDISDEPKSMDNYTVDNENQLKYYKPPSSPTIWHHKWEWVKDDYNGFDVRDAKERSLYWNEQLEGHPDPKIKSRIGSPKVWDELSFNKMNESYDINLRHNVPNDLKKSLLKDDEVGPYVKDINAYDAIYLGDEPIGTIRIDVNPKNGDIRVGSVFIMPQYRGQGYAKKAIELAIKDKPAYTFIAPYNTSSKALFKKLGFSYYRTIQYENEPLEQWERD
jgi:GNAT superfamily N-acetyltransferase